jgi:hypothetical protein
MVYSGKRRGSGFTGSRFRHSRFSPAAGRERPVKSKKETLKKRITNIEQGITNIEVRYSIIIIYEKRLSAAIPPFIIRNFLFDILRFAAPTMCSFIREVQGSEVLGSVFKVQRHLWPRASSQKLCSFVSVVYQLWERFLTAISRVIVAGGHSHQPLTSS